MPRYASASVDIAAPLDVVWSVMLDLPSYPDWNPFIIQVKTRGSAEPAVGDDLLLYVKFDTGKLVRSPECITKIEPQALLEYEFRGPLHNAYLIRGRRQQRLEAHPDGTTRYKTEERFRGLIAFVTPLASVQDGFERHAKALKDRAEKLAG